MTLLESVCCHRHHLRTALVWDDVSFGTPCLHTYSDLLANGEQIAAHLSTLALSTAPIAVYSRNSCPCVVMAILGIMSLSPPQPPDDGCGVRGVAYVPVNLGDGPEEQERTLRRCGVELVLIEISVMEVSVII